MTEPNAEKMERTGKLAGFVARLKERPQTVFFVATTVAAMAYGLIRAYSMRWLCDDIYITFRYIDNFFSGYGLVFNQGDRVEGYTHFLWLCLLALLRWLGIGMESAAMWLGLLSYALIMALFAVISYRLGGRHRWNFPLVTAALALHYDFAIWVTSGLETCFFTLLISFGFFTICFVRERPLLKPLLAGLWFVLGTMTRPDGAVFWLVGLLFLFVLDVLNGTSRSLLFRRLFLYLLPALLVYVPYALWKTLYYGDFLPNTYYAKAADLTYYSQGFLYIWTYLRTYVSAWFFLLSFPFLLIVWSGLPREGILLRLRRLAGDEKVTSAVLALLFIFIYAIGFVARVGGDFMFVRFLYVLIPFSYYLCEVSAATLLASRPKLLLLAGLAFLPLIVFDKDRRDDYLGGEPGAPAEMWGRYGITDEYRFWTRDTGRGLSLIESQLADGRKLRPFLEGEKVSVLLVAQASLAYAAKFYIGIESQGLTDKFIAHLPLERRGRPGHEKTPPWDYLVQRRVNFVFPRREIDPVRSIRFMSGADTIAGYMHHVRSSPASKTGATFSRQASIREVRRLSRRLHEVDGAERATAG